ncbi:PAS domain-containing sensor histidine kinase [Haloterrigena alkaliphila]|uniref:histidine kinase n=1 Tax=Haloterrigena alkaliphila TaxID=2816475 RepID=A0A8A2VI78_9EURY|nr:PAS domain-containing sensor histidine kinase [Haloterrigena alkaliphila]QSX00075.1 PAS domain-containing sensor histidine kinase [Haloterrigena alkaliphila]
MKYVTDRITDEPSTNERSGSAVILETLLQRLPVGVIVEGTDREIIAVNPALCDILGVNAEPSAFVGRDCARVAERQQDLFADSDGFVARIETILERREPVYDEELRLADGRTLERSYVPYALPEGDANLWLYRDVSDRKERQRRLERQNERLAEFVSVVTHDIRNPLNVASANLELAAEEHDSDELDAAASALERMELLIEDLLVLAREGEVIGDTEPVALADLARECWAAVETGDATLEVDVDRTVSGDRSRLAQVFENLFRNSVEHGSTSHSEPDGSEDAVEHGSTSPPSEAQEDGVEHGSTGSRLRADSLEHDSPGVTVTVGTIADGFYVEDDGRGVPEDDRQRIFDREYSTAEDGTGQGLRIVERIVDAHGWEIDLGESNRGGARFEITGVQFVD